MNNLLFEIDGSRPYYETIAGGSGATGSCSGASAVQVHMTNTRITDPEVLEYRYPGVRLERFELRRESGGKGLFNGGDGVVRELKFLKPATVTIISERRNYPPYGMAGGESGKKGKNVLIKSRGEISTVPHRVKLNVQKNDSIRVETPGGGGFGKNPIFSSKKKK
jgi:5-oxoprolinase (ATP-hydrolysing)